MAAKHFVDDPTRLVRTALEAAPLINPSLGLDAENKIVYRRAKHAPQVALVSGGGSGHEPSFTGFVGHGLLSAAVAGSIFASPSAAQVRSALLQRVDGRQGILVILMNYTGDVLNFGMAVESAKASGAQVEMVVVGDDVGVGRRQAGKVGRRGIAGTVLVHKITGALASTGAPLDQVRNIALLTSQNLVSVGASLDRVHVPGRAPLEPTSDETLATGEVEVGMGIHNEPGSYRARLDLHGLVKSMLAQILDDDEDRAFLRITPDDPVVLLLNNLGGVSMLELAGITTEVVSQLRSSYSIKPARILSGTYMTSLNGLGFSITLLKLVDTGLGKGQQLIDLLDAPAEAVGWSAPVAPQSWGQKGDIEEDTVMGGIDDYSKPSGFRMDPVVAKTALESALKRLIHVEADITHYDDVVGDGDCGVGLTRGAEAVLSVITGDQPLSDDAEVEVNRWARIVETSMDGTSGALYTIFLHSLAHSLREAGETGLQIGTAFQWAEALHASLAVLRRYTPAHPGDRTVVDALQPFIEVLQHTGDVKQAAAAAKEGARRTQSMRPSLGRSVYVGGDGWRDVPDPGAHGLSEFLLGFAAGL
ncbi:MAG: hypothetical protein M1838_005952 [Thelocarpon superellum]|nr:MAG: hypothetical protein M1838_005952 [Thelocarpon superellum]